MSYNSGSNRARNFKSASRSTLVPFSNYSRDFSLNCTPLGPITKQLLDEVEYDIMNYQNRDLCYLPKPKADGQITQTRGFDNS